MKTDWISNITMPVYKLPHGLPNDLRLNILGHQEISEKSQFQLETYTSVQSSFQKLNFDKSSQKTLKSRYQTSLVLSNFTRSLYFVPNILLGILVQKSKSVNNSINLDLMFQLIKHRKAVTSNVSEKNQGGIIFSYPKQKLQDTDQYWNCGNPKTSFGC